MSTPQERYKALKQAKKLMTAVDSNFVFSGSSTRTIGKVGDYAFDLVNLADYILGEGDDAPTGTPVLGGWVDEAQLLADGWSVPEHNPTPPSVGLNHPAHEGEVAPTFPAN